MGRLPVLSEDLLRSVPRRLKSEVTSEPPTILVSHPKSHDCSATICAAIMTMKVKGASQHRCDGTPDTIKALPQLKGNGREKKAGGILIHSFPSFYKNEAFSLTNHLT